MDTKIKEVQHLSLWAINYLLRSNEFCKDLRDSKVSSYSDFECNGHHYHVAVGEIITNLSHDDNKNVVIKMPSITKEVFKEIKRRNILNSLAGFKKFLHYEKKFIKFDTNGNSINHMQFFAINLQNDLKRKSFSIFNLLKLYDVKSIKLTKDRENIIYYGDDDIYILEQLGEILKDTKELKEIY